MVSLTGKQKRYLRSIGQRLSADITVGKSGATDALLDHIRRLLEERELIKVRLSEEHTGNERKQAAEELAGMADAACAGVVGRTALLYRPNESLPKEKRISLD
ncbi:MAG: YhbY family RNA-binding protein [Phycisphaerae bacterium]|nr:YhbY family RNA-binding protein [Phycisphaerae bacterium]